MKFAAKSAAALAPILFALAACGGGADEAGEPAGDATGAAATPAPGDAASPAPGETPAPGATPSESPSATPSPAASPSATATPVAAATQPPQFAVCGACHSVQRGQNGIGPSLAGVFGRRAGAVPGFEYSQAMKDSGLTWNQANLDRFLNNPAGVVPGTTMVYPGLKDAAQRQAMIAYLRGL